MTDITLGPYRAGSLPAKKKTKTARQGPGDRRGRAHILSTAIREFSAKGFHGATTAEIARAAGVTQPLVHHHFGSKRGLWEAALQDLFGELRTLQEGTMRDLGGIDLASWLRIFLRQFVLFSARRPELSRIMVVEGSPSKGLDPSIEHHVRPQMEQLYQFLRQVVDQRAIPFSKTQVELLCFLVLGASTHPFLVAGSARKIFGIDMSDGNTAQLYADTVARVLFGALDALEREELAKPGQSGRATASVAGRESDAPRSANADARPAQHTRRSARSKTRRR